MPIRISIGSQHLEHSKYLKLTSNRDPPYPRHRVPLTLRIQNKPNLVHGIISTNQSLDSKLLRLTFSRDKISTFLLSDRWCIASEGINHQQLASDVSNQISHGLLLRHDYARVQAPESDRCQWINLNKSLI